MARIGNPTFTIRSNADANRAVKGIENQWIRFMSAAKEETAPAMKVMGAEIIKETIPITPKKTGALRDSHDMATQISGKEVLLEVSFGNPTPQHTRNPEEYAEAAYLRDIPPERRFTPGTRNLWLKIGGHKATGNQGEEILATELKKRLGL